MLSITIPAVELYDELNEQFIYMEEQTLRLEHSLVSLSKWERKWKKPFLSTKQLTHEETIDYIKCMTLTQNVNPTMYQYISASNIQKVKEYIDDPMTATTFSTDNKKVPNREIITSEIIYYWMITLGIPVEFQKWHLNSLLTLIRVCTIKNSPRKKMSKKEILNRYKELNEARKKQLNTKG